MFVLIPDKKNEIIVSVDNIAYFEEEKNKNEVTTKIVLKTNSIKLYVNASKYEVLEMLLKGSLESKMIDDLDKKNKELIEQINSLKQEIEKLTQSDVGKDKKDNDITTVKKTQIKKN